MIALQWLIFLFLTLFGVGQITLLPPNEIIAVMDIAQFIPYPSVLNASNIDFCNDQNFRAWLFCDTFQTTVVGIDTRPQAKRSIQSNLFSGTLSDSIQYLTNLSFFIFKQEIMNGTIPSAFLKLPKLEYLDFTECDMSTSIPQWIGNISALTILTFSGNTVTGTIPDSINYLTMLTALVISGNQINGTIPQKLNNLTALTLLDFSSNLLSGSIPQDIGCLTSLVNLNLDSNQISGTIPETIGMLTNLNGLSMRINQISGAIPDSIGNLTKLVTLYLQTNQLSGTIPPSVSKLMSLNEMSLSHNTISGTIPSVIVELTYLRYMYIDNNQISGTLPSRIVDTTILNTIDLSHNNITGTIPDLSSGECSYIYLSHNQLDGPIPENLKLSYIYYMLLSNNKITGTIPETIANLNSLNILDLSHNQISGTLSQRLQELTYLNTIDLSHNQISGTIPQSLTNLTYLASLRMNNNNLVGPIPQGFGNQLFFLDLSSNSLNGTVHQQYFPFLNPLLWMDVRSNPELITNNLPNTTLVYLAYPVPGTIPQLVLTLESFWIKEADVFNYLSSDFYQNFVDFTCGIYLFDCNASHPEKCLITCSPNDPTWKDCPFPCLETIYFDSLQNETSYSPTPSPVPSPHNPLPSQNPSYNPLPPQNPSSNPLTPQNPSSNPLPPQNPSTYDNPAILYLGTSLQMNNYSGYYNLSGNETEIHISDCQANLIGAASLNFLYSYNSRVNEDGSLSIQGGILYLSFTQLVIKGSLLVNESTIVFDEVSTITVYGSILIINSNITAEEWHTTPSRELIYSYSNPPEIEVVSVSFMVTKTRSPQSCFQLKLRTASIAAEISCLPSNNSSGLVGGLVGAILGLAALAGIIYCIKKSQKEKLLFSQLHKTLKSNQATK